MSNTNPVVARCWVLCCGCGCFNTGARLYKSHGGWTGRGQRDMASEYKTLVAAKRATRRLGPDDGLPVVIVRRGRRKSLSAQMAECAERSMPSTPRAATRPATAGACSTRGIARCVTTMSEGPMTRPNVYSLGRDFRPEELDEIERLANQAVPGPRDDAFLIPARYAVPDLCRQIRRLLAENADLREKAADAKRVAAMVNDEAISAAVHESQEREDALRDRVRELESEVRQVWYGMAPRGGIVGYAVGEVDPFDFRVRWTEHEEPHWREHVESRLGDAPRVLYATPTDAVLERQAGCMHDLPAVVKITRSEYVEHVDTGGFALCGCSSCMWSYETQERNRWRSADIEKPPAHPIRTGTGRMRGGVSMETVSHRVSRTRRVDAWADSSPHWNGRTLGVEFRIVGVEQDAGKDDDEVSGSINWDGCCNWSTTEGYAAHFCDWQEALEVAECFKVAHALAGVIMAAERLQEANWPDVGAEWTEESDNG